MSLILVDGFDFVDPLVWTSNGAVYSTSDGSIGPRTGSHFLRSAAATHDLHFDLGASEEDDGITVGFGYNNNTSPTLPNAVVLELSEAFGATSHISLIRLTSSRGWEVRRGAGLTPSSGTVLISAIPNVWVADTWHYVELKVKIADSGGTVELRQDGATIGTFTGDTKNAGTDGLIDRIRFNNDTNAGITRLDDVYILNEQGSKNNTFLGDTRMWPLLPDGNGNYSQLVGSDGNSTDNYLLVDEAGAAVESDYVGSATDGDQDSYTFGNLTPTVGTVHAVEIRMHAWKTDTGNKAIRSLVRRSSTDVFGADKVLATTGAPYRQLYEDDPVAAAAWTITNVNGTEFGVEVKDF